MKLHILSDLHNEFSEYRIDNTTASEADVIILAGDVGSGMNAAHYAGMQAQLHGKPVIFILGNHEFYRFEINSLRKMMRKWTTPYESADVVPTHFLDDSEVIINGVRFLGCTLWTDFELFGEELKQECMWEGEQRLNDFRLIDFGEWKFIAADSLNLHKKSLSWLANKLLNEKFDGKTVVITHHLPSMLSVADRYKEDHLSACFASNLDYLFGTCDLWIHGHTHVSFDYTVNETRVICNPRGYSRYEKVNENGHFDPKLLVEI